MFLYLFITMKNIVLYGPIRNNKLIKRSTIQSVAVDGSYESVQAATVQVMTSYDKTIKMSCDETVRFIRI